MRFLVSERPAESASFPIWIVAAVTLAVVAVGYFTWNAHRQDPDYLRAVKLIANFELAKPPEAINYLDSIYTEALADLDRVDPTSVSARPAAALIVLIRNKQKAFTERLRKNQTRIDADRSATTARDEALFEAQKLHNGTDPGAADRVAAIPAPECAEDAASRKGRAAGIAR
jgi:hypothetical protein